MDILLVPVRSVIKQQRKKILDGKMIFSLAANRSVCFSVSPWGNAPSSLPPPASSFFLSFSLYRPRTFTRRLSLCLATYILLPPTCVKGKVAPVKQ